MILGVSELVNVWANVGVKVVVGVSVDVIVLVLVFVIVLELETVWCFVDVVEVVRLLLMLQK